MITGYYNRYGYRIESNGEEIYTAGNSPLDSTSIVPPEQGLSLSVLRKCCKDTCKEFAIERNEPFGDIEREED